VYKAEHWMMILVILNETKTSNEIVF